MTQPNTTELIEQLRTVKTVPEMTRLVILLLKACNIFNYQAIGQELARMSVTAEREGSSR